MKTSWFQELTRSYAGEDEEKEEGEFNNSNQFQAC